MSQDALINYIADLEKKAVIATVNERLIKGCDPFEILDACREGVRLVGKRYEEGRYFIAGLIMAGEILSAVVVMLQPYIRESGPEDAPETIVIGTVQGDIHDIGKNLVAMLLSCQGFKVIDLGVDVAADTFVAAIRINKPKILGLSCLLTTAVDSMKAIIAEIEAADLRTGLSIIVGGALLDEKTCRYTGADHWTTDAQAGVRWCVDVTNTR